ncbi:MAG: DUF4430 domain-containing protein [Faecalicoccus sp.]|nr:DUF4430 domain-containing protein [Faecalicoccus sp.]
MKNKKWIPIVGLLILIAVAFGIYSMNKPEVSDNLKSVTLEVVDSKGKSTDYKIDTEAQYLIGVMDELAKNQDFTYKAEDSEYGAFITEVNGEEAKSEDSAYWAIYVNGEYGQYGASEQPVNDSDAFKLAYEKY